MDKQNEKGLCCGVDSINRRIVDEMMEYTWVGEML